MLPKLWLHLWFKATAVLPVCSCKGAKFGRERWKHNHRFKTSSKMWFLDALSTQKCTLCRGAHLETRWKLKGKWLWCVMVTDLMQSCKTRGLKRFTVSLTQPRAVPFQGYSPSASVEIYIIGGRRAILLLRCCKLSATQCCVLSWWSASDSPAGWSGTIPTAHFPHLFQSDYNCVFWWRCICTVLVFEEWGV